MIYIILVMYFTRSVSFQVDVITKVMGAIPVDDNQLCAPDVPPVVVRVRHL